MKRELKPVVDAMMTILGDARASRIERIECAKLLLSCYGCLLPEINEQWLSVRQITELRRWKRDTVERILRGRAARKIQNRRAYLRRQIKNIEGANEQN